jgi:hypothetical protein
MSRLLSRRPVSGSSFVGNERSAARAATGVAAVLALAAASTTTPVQF